MNEPALIARWRSFSPYLLSLLRIIVGFLFIQYGTTKLYAWPATIIPGGGTVPVLSLAGVAGLLEAYGGILILVGLCTRPVAFLLSGEMAAAYFIGHAGNGFWPVLNQGAPAVFYCFLFLYFSAAGGGAWSVDALRRGRAEP